LREEEPAAEPPGSVAGFGSREHVLSELAPEDRLQPFLLDRLKDDDPASRVESRDRRVFSMHRFREAVLRDLSWLLNSKSKRAIDGLGDFPLVERSVVNFGIVDLTGQTASGISVQQIEQIVRRAIEAFEPRVIRNTLSVRYVDSRDGEFGNVISMEIRGQVWALPMPESLYIKTEVDLETGECELREV
jgi:type VI secretion system protein ImpF